MKEYGDLDFGLQLQTAYEPNTLQPASLAIFIDGERKNTFYINKIQTLFEFNQVWWSISEKMSKLHEEDL